MQHIIINTEIILNDSKKKQIFSMDTEDISDIENIKKLIYTKLNLDFDKVLIKDEGIKINTTLKSVQYWIELKNKLK